MEASYIISDDQQTVRALKVETCKDNLEALEQQIIPTSLGGKWKSDAYSPLNHAHSQLLLGLTTIVRSPFDAEKGNSSEQRRKKYKKSKAQHTKGQAYFNLSREYKGDPSDQDLTVAVGREPDDNGQDIEPPECFIRLTWNSKYLTSATLESFVPSGTMITSKGTSYRITTFLRNESHADVYLVDTLIYGSLRSSFSAEAHIFFPGLKGNWRAYASRHMKRLQNNGNFVDRIRWKQCDVAIVQLPAEPAGSRFSFSEKEFPSLVNWDSCKMTKSFRRHQHRLLQTYAEIVKRPLAISLLDRRVCYGEGIPQDEHRNMQGAVTVAGQTRRAKKQRDLRRANRAKVLGMCAPEIDPDHPENDEMTHGAVSCSKEHMFTPLSSLNIELDHRANPTHGVLEIESWENEEDILFNDTIQTGPDNKILFGRADNPILVDPDNSVMVNQFSNIDVHEDPNGSTSSPFALGQPLEAKVPGEPRIVQAGDTFVDISYLSRVTKEIAKHVFNIKLVEFLWRQEKYVGAERTWIPYLWRYEEHVEAERTLFSSICVDLVNVVFSKAPNMQDELVLRRIISLICHREATARILLPRSSVARTKKTRKSKTSRKRDQERRKSLLRNIEASRDKDMRVLGRS